MADERLRIKIEADAKRAERDLETIAKLANELTEDDLTILIDAKADAAEAEIKSLTKQLAAAEDPVDIKVITTGIAQARQQLDDLGKAGGGARKNIDDVKKSADSSKSVLANMVGNATQDLGVLGGVAGSAGVAIGQMGEYMADARAQGEGFGSIVKNFGAMLGPIALLSIGVGVATSAMNEMKKRAAESAARTKEFGEAMQDTADDAVGLADALRESATALGEMEDPTNRAFGALTDQLESMFENVPLVGKMFEDNFDVVDVMNRAGKSVFDLAKEMENGTGVTTEFTAGLVEAVEAGLITEAEAVALAGQVKALSKETANAAKKQQLFNVNQEEANALLEEMVNQSAPLEKYTHLWDRLMKDMADGTIDTNSTANAINTLATKLGLTQQEVIDLARAGLDDQLAADAEAAQAAADAVAEYDATLRSGEFGSAALTAAGEAFGAFNEQRFAAGNQVQAETEAWNAYVETVKDVGVNMDTTTEKGAAQQDALEDLAGVINTQLAQAYVDAAGDGATFKASAQGIADTLRDRLIKELGFSEQAADDVIYTLGLMPEDIETRYQLSGTEEAKLKLDLLSGSIEALPKDVQAKVTQQIITGDYVGALNTVQSYYDRHPAKLPVYAELKGFRYQGGGGGVVEPATALAAVPTGPAPAAMTTTAGSSTMTTGAAWSATWPSTVTVKFKADTQEVDRAFRNLGGRTQQSVAARYAWRNGRYVEVS